MAGATEELTPLVNQGDGRYTAEYKPKAIGQVSLKAVDAKTQKSSSAELIVFNTPPILSFEPVEFDKLGQVHLIDAGQTLNLSVKALDPDGDKVSLSASILANANFEPSSGKFSYTPTQPPKTEAIFQTVSFSADDGHEGKVSRSLSFQINAKPEFLLIDTQSPSIDPEKAISFSIEENQELSMSIVAKDLNLEQKLSYSAEGLPLALGAKIAKVGSNSGNAKNIVKFDGSRYRFDFTAGIRVGVGKVTITAISTGSKGETNVSKGDRKTIELLPGLAEKLELTASPSKLLADGKAKSEISLRVSDLNDNPILDAKVELKSEFGQLSAVSPSPTEAGVYLAKYVAPNSSVAGVVDLDSVKATVGNKTKTAQLQLLFTAEEEKKKAEEEDKRFEENRTKAKAEAKRLEEAKSQAEAEIKRLEEKGIKTEEEAKRLEEAKAEVLILEKEREKAERESLASKSKDKVEDVVSNIGIVSNLLQVFESNSQPDSATQKAISDLKGLVEISERAQAGVGGSVIFPEVDSGEITIPNIVSNPENLTNLLTFLKSLPNPTPKTLEAIALTEQLIDIEKAKSKASPAHTIPTIPTIEIDGFAIPKPKESKLFANYPNPFNPETWLPYQLSEASEVEMRIYDVRGRLLRSLRVGYRDAGIYTSKDRAAYWDGKDERGEEVASGVYFYQLQAGRFSLVRKMVLLK